jgi:hypothetical protein
MQQLKYKHDKLLTCYFIVAYEKKVKSTGGRKDREL